VLGENGAGKSTLMRLLAGDEFPAAGGSIRRFLPRQGGLQTMLEGIRRGIRLVSDLQQATYTYDITGEELVCSGIDNSVGVYRTLSEADRREARECMALLGVEHLAERSIRRCSTGEMRRMFLARALAGTPDMLLLDEPCSGLDPAARAHVLELISELIARGVQIVLVSHRAEDLIPSVTHLLRLEKGRAVFCGPLPDNIKQQASHSS
ncbi:MAG: ATP-binding cassette domain-containing protein, partial [Desulfovibrionaceae bacterium]|nr:ATP-binding cassette domain-containing protein [Desulfovibrionaceae bacterium]